MLCCCFILNSLYTFLSHNGLFYQLHYFIMSCISSKITTVTMKFTLINKFIHSFKNWWTHFAISDIASTNLLVENWVRCHLMIAAINLLQFTPPQLTQQLFHTPELHRKIAWRRGYHINNPHSLSEVHPEECGANLSISFAPTTCPQRKADNKNGQQME